MPTVNSKPIKTYIYLSITSTSFYAPQSYLNIYTLLINECFSSKTAAS